jgi:hypothetical protein
VAPNSVGLWAHSRTNISQAWKINFNNINKNFARAVAKYFTALNHRISIILAFLFHVLFKVAFVIQHF